MIIVAGDSWACGELHRGDLRNEHDVTTMISHGGLAQFLQEAGHDTVNLGRIGGSNLLTVRIIETWWERNPGKIDKIFVFQTEYTRDYAMAFFEDYDDIQDHHSLSGRMIARFYSRLSNLASALDTKIFLIGGVSDTLAPSVVTNHYPGVEVACQSLTNLLLANDSTISDPVFSWYTNWAQDLVQEVKQKLKPDQLSAFLDEITRSMNREIDVFACPEYFWPDGCHPNRKGHEVLFAYLMENGFVFDKKDQKIANI